MTKDETLLVFTLVVSSSSVSVFLFGILLFMVLISATRDFHERTKSKLVKIMIWAGTVLGSFDRFPWFDRYLWACAQRIQTGIRKQKGEFVVTFSCRVKKSLYARAIEVGIHLSLLSNLFWILKTTLAVGYHLLWVLYYLLRGIFRIVQAIFSLFWLLLSTFIREMVKDLRR